MTTLSLERPVHDAVAEAPAMMARRATHSDDALLSAIVMHLDVRRWNDLRGERIDFIPSLYTGHPASFALILSERDEPMGAFLGFATERHSYHVHTHLLPRCRGSRAIRAAATALEYAFTQTDAEHLTSNVPDCIPQARWFAHAMGFRDTFKQRDGWKQDGELCDVAFLRFGIDDWIQRLPTATCALGEQMHERFEQSGLSVKHAPNEVHNAYVGAAWQMTAAGLPDKGCRIYGRHAREVGYEPYTIVSRDPLTLDVGGGCLLIANGPSGEFQLEMKNGWSK